MHRSSRRPGRGTRRRLSAAAAALVLALVPASAIATGKAPRAWPPKVGKGKLFVHFGEEHVNDADGATLLPKIVRASARYRPHLITMSGDKANNGATDQLQLWRDVMERLDRAGIPWYAGIGNHDRFVPAPGLEGFPLVNTDFSRYRDLFDDRPYPAGDAKEYPGKLITHDRRPEDDPDGAASHFFIDAGPVRWIFLDNSCWSIAFCDTFQFPSGQTQDGEAQFEFFERVAADADDEGLLAFVVMHMPTQDPRDQSYTDLSAMNHTMGKGLTAPLDNDMFESIAETTGVDAVFVAHIKGQFLYEGAGGIPYFIDGGAGGELYTTGPVGVDHGYWHGFRLIRVRRQRFRTDVVPIFVPKGITIEGPRRLERGARFTFAAFGHQPVFNDPAKVPALELRDPDPTPRFARGSSVPPAVLWLGPPALILLLIAVGSAGASSRRRLLVPAVAGVVGLAIAGISVAQQSEPTSTPVDALPNPARIWTSSKPKVLKPVASESDDPRRSKRRQTADGEFKARCPGVARLTITSGFARRSMRVRVVGERPPRCPPVRRR